LVFAANGEIAREVLFDRDFEVEVAVGGEIGHAKAADPESLLDTVLMEFTTPGKGELGGHGIVYFGSIRPIELGCGIR
jgi:hypothetical protein